MTAQPWPDHLLTLEEFDALPEDNSRRYELQEGVLIATPRAAPLHQWTALNLMNSLRAQLPAGLIALNDLEVVTQPGFPTRVRVPDVVVTSVDVLKINPPRLYADQVYVAIEIISPGSRDTDTLVKPVEYANSGIEHYWVIDLEPPLRLTAYRLAGNFGYQKAPAVTDRFSTTEPISLSLELNELISLPSGGKVE